MTTKPHIDEPVTGRRKAPPITFSEFLENVHPSVERVASNVWARVGNKHTIAYHVATPPLRLHCAKCEGERTFRSLDQEVMSFNETKSYTLSYVCGDCHKQAKLFSIWLHAGSSEGGPMGGPGRAYKYGEFPPFGVPVPNRLLRLFGDDRPNFIKGRQCENQGLGVGAFAYYRRVVENHKNDIFNEIIKVCQTLGTAEKLVAELEAAKLEVSFTNAMNKIKSGLPDGLLIDGANPLIVLHGALSVGLHGDSDEVCLETAHAVRLVLTALVERMAMLRQDNAELKRAVQLLIAKKA